jgi:hypothetical protein
MTTLYRTFAANRTTKQRRNVDLKQKMETLHNTKTKATSEKLRTSPFLFDILFSTAKQTATNAFRSRT